MIIPTPKLANRELVEAGYINNRGPNRAVFIDTSKKMRGQRQMKNRSFKNEIDIPWTGDISSDFLRRQFKTTFFRKGL